MYFLEMLLVNVLRLFAKKPIWKHFVYMKNKKQLQNNQFVVNLTKYWTFCKELGAICLENNRERMYTKKNS